MLPVIAVISAMQFLLYETATGAVNAILLQFFSAIGLGYVSGCLYPINFFPEKIRRLGAVLPTGTCRTYLEKSLISLDKGDELLLLTAWGIFFLGISVAVRRKKTN